MNTSRPKKKGLIKWQLPMKRVLYALIPAMLASVYFFGWKSLVILVLVNAVGFLTEYLFLLPRKEQVSSAVFVTGCLFALALPPTIPYWMAVVGIVFAVLFGKMVFGGFGRNVFNPAMTGRAFLYVSFGMQMTNSWVEPLRGFPAGFGVYAADAVTEATSLVKLSAQAAAGALAGAPLTGAPLTAAPLTGDPVSWLSLLWGNVSGSFGETSAILLALGGIYLIWKKAASYQIVLSGLGSFLLFQTIFWLAGIPQAADPLHALLAGSFVMGVFFIITDPVSAGQTTDLGRWIYGAFFGAMVVVIRLFSVWPAAVMFATLLANTFAHILDYGLRQIRAGRSTS